MKSAIFFVVLLSLIKRQDILAVEVVRVLHYEDVPIKTLFEEVHPCKRPCEKYSSPMRCRYDFKVEWYTTMSKACYDCPIKLQDCFRKDCIPANGFERPVVSVNRQLPGPKIEVCLNDEIVVDVHNGLMGEGTTIHWHGLHMKDTPYMDGVPLVTQCTIPYGSSFRYRFKASQAGTYFWHSHVGLQRIDGMFGPLIIRPPLDQNPHLDLYEEDLSEHIITLIDWSDSIGINKFIAHHHSDGNNKPPFLLVNGLGRFKQFLNVTNGKGIYTPTARFHVTKGKRYRFRVINAGYLNCPIEVSIDNHNMLIISMDGSDIKPIEAVSMVTYAGERFDFILNANQHEALYWIRFKGLMDCDERFTKAREVAVLEYKGVSIDNYNDNEELYPYDTDTSYEKAHREGLQVNPLNVGTEHKTPSKYVTLPEIHSLVKNNDFSLRLNPDYKLFVAFDFYGISDNKFHKSPYYGFDNVTKTQKKLLTPQFNHISMKLPDYPLLPQRSQINESIFCNIRTLIGRDCVKEFCECTHLGKVELGSVIEMIFIDEGVAYNANHPIHIHGYSFRVVAMERIGETVTPEKVVEMDNRGLIKRNLVDPPLKDTITVPDGGFTIVRFQANNPGFWLLHCHIEFHADIGMALLIQVGNHTDMKEVPENFPKCGSYLPDVEATDNNGTSCSENKFLNQFNKWIFGGEKGCTSGSCAIQPVPKHVAAKMIGMLMYFIHYMIM